MADNTIEYTLALDTSSYVSGTKKAAEETGKLGKAQDDVKGSSSKLAGSLSDADKKMGGFGASAGQSATKLDRFKGATGKAGTKLKDFADKAKKAAVVVGALGGAAVAMGTSYDREFSKITGLVGIAKAEVDEMKAATLLLAGETAQAPQTLAKAMFTLQSAGLRGADATEALASSAKLAAGGMGEAGDIAQAMTSILDQFGKKGVDAAEAADFLASTARAGNFESSQLAGALGKVLPVAATLDIGLRDVGGTVALLTRGNGNASESVTQLAATLRFMLSPSRMAIKGLGEVGLTVDDLKKTAAGPGGLVEALRQMYDAFDNNDQAFAKALGSSEAVNAAFQILGASNEALEGTFGAVGDSAGVAAEVFAAAAETDSFKLEQALTTMKTKAIDLGEALAGPLASAAEFASGLLGSMGDTTKNMMIVFGLALLAIGPLTKAITAMLAMNPLLLGLAGGIAVITAMWSSGKKAAQEAKETAEDLGAALLAEGDEAQNASVKLGVLVEKLHELKAAQEIEPGGVSSLSEQWALDIVAGSNMVEILNEYGIGLDKVSGSAKSATVDTEATLKSLNRYINDNKSFMPEDSLFAVVREQMSDLPPAMQDVLEEILSQNEGLNINRDRLVNVGTELQAVLDIYGVMTQAHIDERQLLEDETRATIEQEIALGNLSLKQRDQAFALAEAGEAARSADAMFLGVATATDEGVRASGRYTNALPELNAAIEKNVKTQEMLVNWQNASATSMGENEMSLYATAEATDELAASEAELAEQYAEAIKDLPPYEQMLAGFTDELQLQIGAMVTASQKIDLYKQALAGLQGGQQSLDAAARRSTENLKKLAEEGYALAEEELQSMMLAEQDHIVQMIGMGATSEEVAAQQQLFIDTLFGAAQGNDELEEAMRGMLGTYFDIPPEMVVKWTSVADSAAAEQQLVQDVKDWQETYGYVALEFDIQVTGLTDAQRLIESAFNLDSTYGAADLGSLGGSGAFIVETQLRLAGENVANAQLQRWLDMNDGHYINVEIRTGSGASTGSSGTSQVVEDPAFWGTNGALSYSDPSDPNDPAYYQFGGGGYDYSQMGGVFHDGGMIGMDGGLASSRLASDERVIVGQTGERVLNRAETAEYDSGARFSAGGAGGNSQTVNVSVGDVIGSSGASAADIADEVADRVAAKLTNSMQAF